jgi:hypothetical protein
MDAMPAMGFTTDEIKLYQDGPFPGRVDPWAEDDHYFQMIHASMIDSLLEMTQRGLAEMGYFAGREASMQILEGREPDVFIRFALAPPKDAPHFSYELAAVEALAEPGLVTYEESAIDAIYVRSSVGDMVTIIEVISPRNKRDRNTIQAYRERRLRLCIERGINLMEIDITRSVIRLTAPSAYERAYQRNHIAQHSQIDHQYAEDHLPFPSLLTDEQRAEALAAVKAWQAALAEARPSS